MRPHHKQASGAYASFCCPLWTRAHDFMRVAIGTFFVAIYAVGGVYLSAEP